MGSKHMFGERAFTYTALFLNCLDSVAQRRPEQVCVSIMCLGNYLLDEFVSPQGPRTTKATNLSGIRGGSVRFTVNPLKKLVTRIWEEFWEDLSMGGARASILRSHHTLDRVGSADSYSYSYSYF